MAAEKTSLAVFNGGNLKTYCSQEIDVDMCECSHFGLLAEFSPLCKWLDCSGWTGPECRCKAARDQAQRAFFAEQSLDKKLEDL